MRNAASQLTSAWRGCLKAQLDGGELSADRTMPAEHSHADIHVAIHDAFDAVLRQLENWKHRQRGEIKTHEESLRGRIAATA